MGSLCSICAETNPAFTATGGSLEENAEKSISMAERKCPISRKPPNNIRNSIKGEAQNGRLSLTQVKRAGGSLGLEKEDLQNPDSTTFHFLNSLADDGQEFDEHFMVICSLLISGSSNKDKAIAFFEIFDKDGNKTIKTREVTRFAKDCFDASVDKLPNLAKGSSTLVSQGITDYIGKLKPHREKFAEDTVQIILKGQPELGQAQFIDVVLREAPFAVSSSGIRCEVYKNYVLKGN
ncbi:hypothetical protein SteCoe_36089 [Stentor coeruleus]|uniref:EF-hand domain-containing protein n=1 Tax=Stentor coeruleus TaxID=5963 RepID=A0A1R2AQW1_9CILI|nr:hypothetical protein SteCoe_36089 [Stentor coeruleus]